VFYSPINKRQTKNGGTGENFGFLKEEEEIMEMKKKWVLFGCFKTRKERKKNMDGWRKKAHARSVC
jgi:hypothetical protein